ncbi:MULTISPECIES: restriction endonuclease subunit S [unclassified Enterobacter]|uniref:restriction endonuclease subunit S n=2 Tax=Enterobacter TaxID=547 RepID=UPI002147B2A9|nr:MULTISPECIES: restriction endonuclease subunit S [unclassified Enterobacter]MCR1310314.1 restriction endonuclease subunit S [Enterobacter sp. BT1271]MCR1315364.1 restriction endonuclease subunit S [Enterobacter sp. BT855]MCR1334601.1 restriction endonuclease subunit S [Enterobacter sp. BT4]MCR1340899.1 restriction endonuclease subunit S [Enterobacter sp. BT223]
MSEMSYLEKLLDGVEVEWKAVGDIAGYSTTKVDADKLDATSFVGVDNLLADKGGRIDATYQPNTARLTAYEPGDILLGNIRPYLKKVWMAENNGGCSGDVLAIRILADCKKIISPEYLYYALSSDSFFSYSMQHAKGAKMPRGSKDAILNYQIPIPCPSAPGKSLAIQSEIVRILDKFTALTAELTAELTMRKKQYNYYRDKLLSFEECEVEWKTLDEVASFRRGSFPQPYGNSEWYNGEGCMPFVQVADVADFGFRLHRSTKQQISKLAQSKSVFVEAGTVIVSLQGTIGRVALTQYDCYVDRTLAIFTKYKAAVNKKYFAHQLKAKFDLEKEFARGSTLKTITKEEFSKFQIPIPPLEVQNRIVALLDKFDRLTHSIEEGLPRELELRQKQYEYYRELLFSFPKLEAASN